MLRLEFSAVQIIAVDTVRKSGSHKAGYLSKAGHPIQNTDSTGDLNRGRRVKPRLLFGSFCRSKKNKPVSLSGTFHCMESMPLSGQHAMRAREFRGFANLDSVRRSAALPTVEPLGRSLSGTFSLLLKRQDKSTGRRGAAPYLYTQNVYKCTTLRVYRSLALQAFIGGRTAA